MANEWEEITPILGQAKSAFGNMETKAREFSDSITHVTTLIGIALRKAEVLSFEIQRLANEKAQVLLDLQKQRSDAEAQTHAYRNSKLAEVTAHVQTQMSLHESKLKSVESKILDAEKTLDEIKIQIEVADKSRVAHLMMVDTETSKANARLADVTKRADQAQKDFEARIGYLEKQYNQREADLKARLNAIEADIAARESRLIAVKQAARSLAEG